jgi:uncharacterized protein YjbI with pentapeptide repeats
MVEEISTVELLVRYGDGERNFAGIKLVDEQRYHTDYDLVDLRDFDLRGINLRGADLSEVNLTGANLSGADLAGVCLQSSLLIGVYHCLLIADQKPGMVA